MNDDDDGDDDDDGGPALFSLGLLEIFCKKKNEGLVRKRKRFSGECKRFFGECTNINFFHPELVLVPSEHFLLCF